MGEGPSYYCASALAVWWVLQKHTKKTVFHLNIIPSNFRYLESKCIVDVLGLSS